MATKKKSTPLDRLIVKFTSASNLARCIGCSKSAISQAKKRGGFIPQSWHDPIIKAAMKNGIKLDLAELVR